MRFWFVLANDIERPIGGVKQIHRLCECLNLLGYTSTIIQESGDFSPPWFTSNISSISLADFLNRSDINIKQDIMVVPETMIPYVKRFLPGFKKIIFNQNVSYTFGVNSAKDGFPNSPDAVLELYLNQDVLAVWCVSSYDYKSLVSGFGFSSSFVSRIVNPIEPDIFYPSFPKMPLIAYMTRKNPMHSRRVRALFKRHSYQLPWAFLPIHNLNLAQVSEVFRKSLVFFSFGHPEGFGLPVAEAMACGCVVIGYSGLGGDELFSLAENQRVGKRVDFGDLPEFLNALHHFELSLLDAEADLARRLSTFASSISQTYSMKSMVESVSIAVKNLAFD